MVIRPACGQARFPLFRCFGGYTLPPGIPITLPTGESRGLRVSRRLYNAAYVRSRARHRDRRISRSSGVSKARHCLLRALSLDSQCCRASTLSVARRFVARWRFLVRALINRHVLYTTEHEPEEVRHHTPTIRQRAHWNAIILLASCRSIGGSRFVGGGVRR